MPPPPPHCPSPVLDLTCGVTREEPNLLLRVATVASFAAADAFTRHGQLHIPHQVPAECCPSCFLYMKEHEDILAFNVKIIIPVETALREILVQYLAFQVGFQRGLVLGSRGPRGQRAHMVRAKIPDIYNSDDHHHHH